MDLIFKEVREMKEVWLSDVREAYNEAKENDNVYFENRI